MGSDPELIVGESHAIGLLGCSTARPEPMNLW
jgi:hypothetical protein